LAQKITVLKWLISLGTVKRIIKKISLSHFYTRKQKQKKKTARKRAGGGKK